MTQEVFPEIRVASQALEQRIAATQAEINQLKASIAVKENLISGWQKVVTALQPASPEAEAVTAPHTQENEFFF